MKNKIYYIFVLIVLNSCSPSPEKYIEHITGYWQITQVEQNNKLLKKYTISTSVDYFKIENNLTGFKKKVTPTFRGSFIITKHHIPFSLKIENDSLNIYYINEGITIKETILKASKKELIITNSNGLKYTYKPYEKIELQP